VACAHDGGKLVHKSLSDFGPKDFEKPEFEAGWFMQKGSIDFAATDNAYFAQAIVSLEAPAAPACGLQIEERWYREQYPDKTKDPAYGSMYRSRRSTREGARSPRIATCEAAARCITDRYREVLAKAMGGQHQRPSSSTSACSPW
jgi:hypothetical protein